MSQETCGRPQVRCGGDSSGVCVCVSSGESDYSSLLRHILGFPTEELLRGPIIRELQEQLSQQLPYLHLIHWCVCVSLSLSLSLSLSSGENNCVVVAAVAGSGCTAL